MFGNISGTGKFSHGFFVLAKIVTHPKCTEYAMTAKFLLHHNVPGTLQHDYIPSLPFLCQKHFPS